MDHDALRKDLDATLTELPPEVIDLLSKLADKHGASLETSLPKVMQRLLPHLMAGISEFGFGMLDMAGLQSTVMAAIKDHGIKQAMLKHGTDAR